MSINRVGMRLAQVSVLVVFGALVIWFSPEGDFGIWSLLPALTTIAICFITRNVLLALFLGIVAGALVAGEYNVVRAFLIPSLGTENYAQILLVYLWALGGLLGIWSANGGARHFAERVAQVAIRSRRSAKVFAWFLGVVFHQGGTISTVLAGTTVRPISDRHGVAHEELSYVVDSTASPIATIIPFNVWPIYVAGLLMIEPLSAWIPNQDAAVQMFYTAIPFNFYALIAVTMTLLLAMDRLPLFNSRMAQAVSRAQRTGALDDENDSPLVAKELTESNVAEGYQPGLIDFFVPMGTLMAFCLTPLLFGASPMVFEGFGAAVVAALIASVIRGMAVSAAFDALVMGIKNVTVGALHIPNNPPKAQR